MAKKPNHIEYKMFSFELKDIDDKGKFKGLMATNGRIDPIDDRFNPGVWKKSLSDWGSRPIPLLKSHDRKMQLGSYHGKDVPDGLLVDAKLNLTVISNTNMPAVPNAWEQYALYKNGDADGLSVGFRPIDSKTKYVNVDGRIVRDMFEAQLFEGSMTPIPMDVHARVTNVKGMDDLFTLIIKNLGDKDLKYKIFSLYGYEPETIEKWEATLEPGKTTPEPVDIASTQKGDRYLIDIYEELIKLEVRQNG